MKYRVRFDGYVDIEKDDAEEVYCVVKSKFDELDMKSRGEDGISVIDVYNFDAEELEQMTNKEKYAKELLNVACAGNRIAIDKRTMQIRGCANLPCMYCLFKFNGSN